MRIVLFLFLFILSVSTAFAQDQEVTSFTKEVKVATIHFSIAPVPTSNLLLDKTNAISGIFVMKNSRVKRALSFKVKTRNPKLA
mgnify:CR=1 FL=1